GRSALLAAPQLGAFRGPLLAERHVQLWVVLVGDQDLRNVAFGRQAQAHAPVDQRLCRRWDPWHVGRGPYSVAACKRTTSRTASGVPPAPVGGESRSTSPTASKSCCRAARPSAKHPPRFASCGPGSTGAWPSSSARGRRSPRAGRRCPTSARC